MQRGWLGFERIDPANISDGIRAKESRLEAFRS